MAHFISNEDGAVTVDWVVLTAALVGLGLATMSVVSTGVEDLSTDIDGELSRQDLVQTSFTPNLARLMNTSSVTSHPNYSNTYNFLYGRGDADTLVTTSIVDEPPKMMQALADGDTATALNNMHENAARYAVLADQGRDLPNGADDFDTVYTAYLDAGGTPIH